MNYFDKKLFTETESKVLVVQCSKLGLKSGQALPGEFNVEGFTYFFDHVDNIKNVQEIWYSTRGGRKALIINTTISKPLKD